MGEITWPKIALLLIGVVIILIPWVASVVAFVLFPALAIGEYLCVAAIMCCLFDFFAGMFITDFLERQK